MVKYLSEEDVINIFFDLVKKFEKSKDPIGMPHVHSYPLLGSSVARPKTTVNGKDAYRSLAMKAAVLAESIIRNHAFGDGNKRTGMMAASTFLEMNGKMLELKHDEFYALAMKIARNEIELHQVTSIMSNNIRDFDEWMNAHLQDIEEYKGPRHGDREDWKYSRKKRKFQKPKKSKKHRK